MPLSRFFVTILCVLCATAGTAAGQDGSATVLRNARVFDGVTERLSGATDVLVVDGLIDSIGAWLNVPDGAKEIDAGGRTLMPGLINAHAHVMLQLPVWQALTSDTFMFAYVATVAARSLIDNGFTSIRDMSGNSFSLKQAIDRGVLPGPRIFPSGAMISQTSGHSDDRTAEASSRLLDPESRSALEKAGMTIVADGREQVLQAARENLRRGATQIKIAVGGGIASYGDPLDVTQYTEDEILAAVEAAADWGTYVAAHVYNSKGVRRAVDLGVRSIEHANLIDRDTLKHMAKHDVWLSPQVLIFQQELQGMTPDQLAKQQQALAGLNNLMSMASEMDYRNIVFGCDIVTSLQALDGINQELVIRTQWFTPFEVLRQATSKAGELLALSGPRNPYGKLGVIEPGAVADLLIVDGNPLEDIAVPAKPRENLRLIMQGGRLHKNTL
jgi:imidazolonepropionase-like amidohydrolase